MENIQIFTAKISRVIYRDIQLFNAAQQGYNIANESVNVGARNLSFVVGDICKECSTIHIMDFTFHA